MALYAAVILLLSWTSAFADVYRCERNGKLQFSDRACEAGQLPLDVAAPNVLETSRGDRELARAFDAETTLLRAARAKASAEARESEPKPKAATSSGRKSSAKASKKILKAPKQPRVAKVVEKPAQLTPRR